MGRSLDGADDRHGLAQQVVRAGLDRAGRVGLDEGAEEDAGARARAGVDGERVEADLGAAEVDVVDGAVLGDQPEREPRELLLRVDDDDRALVVAGVDGHAGRHLGGLARPLAAHQRLAELAVLGVDPDRAVLVDEQPARRVAANLGGSHRAPQRHPRDAG